MQDNRAVGLGLVNIQDLLACPKCRGIFERNVDSLVCQACGSVFPILDGVPMLAVLDEAETKPFTHKGPTRESYQQEYQQFDAAAGYNLKYKQHALKRWSTRREFHLLYRLLSSQPRSRTLLELPCGGGRLSSAMAKFTDLLIEADVAMGQVQYSQQHSLMETAQIWMTASALHIPFRDAVVDGVVCIRLCHHLHKPEEREQLVVELLRVARRFVIVTFFDYHSLKNIIRRVRQPLHRKRPKYTMTVGEIDNIARRHNARLEAYPRLSWIGSGHRYALLVKS